MKALLIIVFILAAFAYAGCEKSDFPPDIPPCIKDTINVYKNKPDWLIGNVEAYSFQGKIVYAFNPDNKRIADGQTYVVNSDCGIMCAVGGFGGPSINLCNGDNFFQKAVFIRKIWEKP